MFHTYAIVTILQHLMALAIAVMIYALARHRFRAPSWLATLAAVPVLYDGFGIQLEHLILSDIPFLFVLMLAVTLLLWDPAAVHAAVRLHRLCCSGSTAPALGRAAAARGVRRVHDHPAVGWRKVAAAIVVCLVPVFAYAGVFELEHGQFAMTDSTGVFLYSRVMTFADCAKMQVPAGELFLCTPCRLPSGRSRRPTSGPRLRRWTGSRRRSSPPVPNQLAERFAIRAIEAQPLSYAKAVFDDTWRVFAWKRTVFPQGRDLRRVPVRLPLGAHPDLGPGPPRPYGSYAAAYVHGNPLTQVVAPFANIIRGYQRYVWLPGTVYGLILLAGLGGMVLAWRRIGGEALLPWTISLALIVIPAATAEFDYRYVLAAAPFACLAAAMAFSPGTAGGELARRLAAAPSGPEAAAGRHRRNPASSSVAGQAAARRGGTGDDQSDLASDGT